jgi:catechol 1,2-dioxygenase
MVDDRLVSLFDEFAQYTRDFIVRHNITYDDFDAVIKYFISVGEQGEWPLFLDLFLESTVDTTSYGAGPWTPSNITGPYYKAGAPILNERPATLPMRENEPGQPMFYRFSVTNPDGDAVPAALLDVWHSTNDGIYSFYNPRVADEYLLRGRIYADDKGELEFRSIKPVPYQVPSDGPVGDLLNHKLGRHSWRPAHLHVLITADGYVPLTTQLYFDGDPYLDSDSCTGVKNELVVSPMPIQDGDHETQLVDFTFVLQPSSAPARV